MFSQSNTTSFELIIFSELKQGGKDLVTVMREQWRDHCKKLLMLQEGCSYV